MILFAQQFILVVTLFFLGANTFAQDSLIVLPDTSKYIHQSVSFDFIEGDKAAQDVWVFQPKSPKPKQADVVIFNHGYGAYNPACYGAWIEHLVKRGNIVIFPRYQHTSYTTLPGTYTEHAAQAILNSIDWLKKDTGRVQPNLEHVALVGHSFGGVISANLVLKYKEFKLPKPKALMVCQPGTGGFKSGRYKSYEDMDTTIYLLSVIGEDDFVVGGFFGKELFYKTKIPTSRSNLVIHKRDLSNGITATHNEPVAVDKTYDGDVTSGVILGSYAVNKEDQVDYYCYWKLFDALLDCSFYDKNCQIAFGNTPEQKYMGVNEEGEPIEELEVITNK